MTENTVASIESYLQTERNNQAFALKLEAIKKNAFSFFRGTSHLYYQFLQQHNSLLPASPVGWLCGDLHIENFGTYKAANGITYFDINDFDEGTQGPILIDVARLLTSLHIGLEQLGVNKATLQKQEQYFLSEYTQHLIQGKATDVEANTATGVVDDLLEQVAKRSEEKFVESRIEKTKKGWQLQFHEKCWPLDKADKKKYKEAFTTWVEKQFNGKYELVDIGYRIAGTGSLGTPRYMLLLQHHKKNSRILLDAKQALPPASALALPVTFPILNHANRIYTTQFKMQHEVPALLQTATIGKQHFVVKKLQPSTDKLDWQNLVTNTQSIKECIHYLAITTANAQLRSSGRLGTATADDLAEFARDTAWQKTLLRAVNKLASNVHYDYALFTHAVTNKNA